MNKILFDTKKFNKDLKQISQNVKPLVQSGIIQKEDIRLIEKRIWETIPKYIVVNVY